MSPRLRDDPAWRAMFARLKAKATADRIAEAVRWRGLSAEEKRTEMAAMVGRWRGLTCERRDGIVTRAVDAVRDCE
jgi:hypothetical protein